MKKIFEVQGILYLPIIVRREIYRFFGKDQYSKLLSEKKAQVDNFSVLAGSYKNMYLLANKYPFSKYVTGTWSDFNQKMKAALLPKPKFNFLNNPFIIYSMYMTKGGRLMKNELAYLEKKYSVKFLKQTLKEDIVGSPLIMNRKYLTSHNRINMLYHLARFENSTSVKISRFRTITEWGSGFGGMVAVIKRFINKPVTYICIDTPLIVCLQWLYLGSIFGLKSVKLITNPKDKIEKNKINLIPVSLASKFKYRSDLFISTWALSESSKSSHNLVRDKKWFGAKHLLIGYQRNCDFFEGPERVGKFAVESGAKIEPVSLFPDNYYAFK